MNLNSPVFRFNSNARRLFELLTKVEDHIGVILLDQREIGLLDIVSGCVERNSEHLVPRCVT